MLWSRIVIAEMIGNPFTSSLTPFEPFLNPAWAWLLGDLIRLRSDLDMELMTAPAASSTAAFG